MIEAKAPKDALAALADLPAGQTVILDLDETLLLVNSTELFLDHVRPRRTAAVLLRLLDIIKPWRWLPRMRGDENAADWLRVRIVQRLAPWALRHWRAHCREHAAGYLNRDLIDALPPPERNPRVVATLGFSEIVTPLIEGSGVVIDRLVAVEAPTDRQIGKLGMIRKASFGIDADQAVVVTDSLTDTPLLEACATPLYVKWPQARYRRAGAQVYSPFAYTSRVKHADQHFLRRSILEDDFFLILLASAAFWQAPLWAALGGFLLLISFWTVYEMGYIDNDRMAADREHDPSLSAGYFNYPFVVPSAVEVVAWAGASGALGLALLGHGQAHPDEWLVRAAVIWAGILLATWVVFRGYNRLNKRTRPFVYPWLQFARLASPMLLLGTHTVGVIALVAVIWLRSVQYFFFRAAPGSTWPDLRTFIARGYLFAILLGAALLHPALRAELLAMPTLALAAWFVARARGELRELVGEIGRLPPRQQ